MSYHPHIDVNQTSLAAKIPRWRSCIQGAWLIEVSGVEVSMYDDVALLLQDAPWENCLLLFDHIEVQYDRFEGSVLEPCYLRGTETSLL